MGERAQRDIRQGAERRGPGVPNASSASRARVPMGCAVLVACFLAVISGPFAAAQQPRWEELNAQVEQLYQNGDYAAATPIALKAVKAAEAAFGPDDANTATALNNLALLYEKQDKNADAEPLFERALSIREKALGAEDPLVASSLGMLAQLYGGESKYAQAIPLFERAIAIDEKALGADATDVATLCGNLGEVYEDAGKYADAEPLLQRALAIDEKALGAENADLAADLNNLAELYDEEGKYAQELPLLQRALAIDEKAYEPDHPIVAKALNNLAEAYVDLGRLSEAEPLLKRSLAMREKKLGPDDPDVATALSNLAELDQAEGAYGAAEPLLERALRIDEKALGPDDLSVAVDVNNLANLYDTQGKYASAEPLFQRSLAIRVKVQGQDHPDVATVLGNLGGLYLDEGRYDEAKAHFLEALEIDRKKLDPDAPQLATDLNNLANVAGDLGAYADAEQAYQLVVEIDEKSLGSDNPTLGTALANLAGVYFDENKYPQAEEAIQRSLKITESALGANHPDLASGLDVLASIYDSEGRYAEAAPLYQRAIHIQESVLGPDHPALVTTVGDYAESLDSRGDFKGAEAQFQRVFDNLFKQFAYDFTYMTEKERLEFLESVENNFPVFFSFVDRFHGKDPELVGAMYNLLLWEKGFVAGSIAGMRRAIESSGDKEALKLLDDLAAKRAEIAALVNVQPPDRDLWRQQIEQLQAEADAIEKELVARSAAFAAKQKLDRTTWQQVRDSLKPGEAAVEFAHFQYFDKEWTKKSYYVALVVTRESRDEPEYIVLGDDQQLENDVLGNFKSSVQTRGVDAEQEPAAVPGARAYEFVWKPLEAALAGTTRLYLAPDGALNEVPLGVIPGPDGKLMMERIDLRLVSSTRDLLQTAQADDLRSALLLGDPAFDESVAQQKASVQQLGLSGSDPQRQLSGLAISAGQSSDVSKTPKLPPLPGTGAEVSAIATLMKNNGWQTGTYTGDSALKTVVEQAAHPRVIHLATHGFFLPDPAAKSGQREVGEAQQPMEDPMVRSGLYFAAADRTLGGAPPVAGLDNGVLTAMEAVNLDLRGTELVVLSACNTARGDVQSGEGVFGLRRGFEEAGARSVLMSLWSVPDMETRELMSLFYAKWLAGMDKAEALRQAQMEERATVQKRYGKDLPFYWGAFVLVGE